MNFHKQYFFMQNVMPFFPLKIATFINKFLPIKVKYSNIQAAVCTPRIFPYILMTIIAKCYRFSAKCVRQLEVPNFYGQL